MSTDGDNDPACPNASGISDTDVLIVTKSLSAHERAQDSNERVEKSKRKVCFPHKEDQLVTRYFEPANPWHDVPPTTKSQLIEQYVQSCVRHNTSPIECVIEQIQELPDETIGGGQRAPRLYLYTCDLLGTAPVDALEEVLRKVQFRRIQLEGVMIDDAGAEALFDMIEYYESANTLSIAGHRDFGISGWQAATRMLKKSAELTELEARDHDVTASQCAVLSRGLRAGSCELTALCLHRAGLAGEPLLCLAIALKCNQSIRELRLGDNNLTPHDALQLAALLRSNCRLTLLDLADNGIQDSGVGYIADALLEQSAPTSPNYSNAPSGLTFLVLWNNQLTRNCAHHLNKLLNSPTLLVLNVGRNPVGCGWACSPHMNPQWVGGLACLGLQAVCARDVAVLASLPLQRIDLRDNRLSSDSLKSLLEAMKEHKSVTQFDLDDYENPTLLSEDTAEVALCAQLANEIRSLCRKNECEERIQTVRKISLTGHSARWASNTGGPSSGRARPARRLRSPSPSPAHSPRPHNNRFTVTRVSGGGSPTTPTKCGGSRFTVMQVTEPPKIQVEPPLETPKKASRFSVTRNYDNQYTPSASPPYKPLSPLTPPSLSPSPPAFSISPPAILTSPPAILTSPPAILTSPPAILTSPPAILTSPPEISVRLVDLSSSTPMISTSPLAVSMSQPVITTSTPATSLPMVVSPCPTTGSTSPLPVLPSPPTISTSPLNVSPTPPIPTSDNFTNDQSVKLTRSEVILPKPVDNIIVKDDSKYDSNSVVANKHNATDVNVQFTVVKEHKSDAQCVKNDSVCVKTSESCVKVYDTSVKSDETSLPGVRGVICDAVDVKNDTICVKFDEVFTNSESVSDATCVKTITDSVKTECFSKNDSTHVQKDTKVCVKIDTECVKTDLSSLMSEFNLNTPVAKTDGDTMKQIEAITQDLGNLIQEMRKLSNKNTAVAPKPIDTKNTIPAKHIDIIEGDNVPGKVNRDIVFKKNKSETSLDSPDLEISRLLDKKMRDSPFCDSSSSLEISGSSVESLDNTQITSKELIRRRILTSTDSSVDSNEQNHSRQLNMSVSSTESVSPVFGKTNAVDDSLSSLDASVSSLDTKTERLMMTSADSGIEYSLKNTFSQGTITSRIASDMFQDAQDTLTMSPKRTSSLLDVPDLKRNTERVRKISVIASPSFHIPKPETEKEPKLTTHLEKLLSLFQHPASIFKSAQQSDDERKSASNTPPRKESSGGSSSFWSWGSSDKSESEKGSKEDSPNDSTESTLSERVQVSFVDESFSHKLDSKTPSTDTDNTLSEFHSLTETDKKLEMPVTTEYGLVQNVDVSSNGNNTFKDGTHCDRLSDLIQPNDLNKNLDTNNVRPRSFAAVLKATGSENTLDKTINSPDSGHSVDKLPSKVIRGIKENISPENTLTNAQSLALELSEKHEKPIENVTVNTSAEATVDLGKDALSYLIYENQDFEPVDSAEVETNIDKAMNLSDELRDAETKQNMDDISPELVIDEVPEKYTPLVDWKVKKSNSLETLNITEGTPPKDENLKKPKNIAFDVPEYSSTPRDIPKSKKFRSRSGSSPKSLPETFKQSSLPKIDHSFCKKKRKVSSLGKIAKDSLLALNMSEEEIQEFRRSYKPTSIESLTSVSEDNFSQSGNSDSNRCRCLRLSQESLMSLDSITEDCKCGEGMSDCTPCHKKCP